MQPPRRAKGVIRLEVGRHGGRGARLADLPGRRLGIGMTPEAARPGLAISRRFLPDDGRRHHRREPPSGRGSAFTITLPAVVEPAAPEVPPPERRRSGRAARGLPKHHGLVFPLRSAGLARAPSWGRPRRGLHRSSVSPLRMNYSAPVLPNRRSRWAWAPSAIMSRSSRRSSAKRSRPAAAVREQGGEQLQAVLDVEDALGVDQPPVDGVAAPARTRSTRAAGCPAAASSARARRRRPAAIPRGSAPIAPLPDDRVQAVELEAGRLGPRWRAAAGRPPVRTPRRPPPRRPAAAARRSRSASDVARKRRWPLQRVRRQPELVEPGGRDRGPVAEHGEASEQRRVHGPHPPSGCTPRHECRARGGRSISAGGSAGGVKQLAGLGAAPAPQDELVRGDQDDRDSSARAGPGGPRGRRRGPPG